MQRFLALFLILTMVVIGTVAQARPATPPSPPAAETSTLPVKFFSFELGMPIGYNLANGALVSGRHFGIGFPLTDSLELAVVSRSLAAGAAPVLHNAIRVSYSFIQMMGASIFLGQAGANPGAGLGLYMTLLPEKNAAGLGTALRLRLDYAFDTTNVGGGSILLTTAFLFGM